jgi:hypothetical protein
MTSELWSRWAFLAIFSPGIPRYKCILGSRTQHKTEAECHWIYLESLVEVNSTSLDTQRRTNTKCILQSIYQLKSTIYWDMTPCSPLNVNRRFGATYRLHLQGRRISRARNQRESRSQVDGSDMFEFQQTRQRYIPEDSTLHNHRCENLKSYNLSVVIETWIKLGIERYYLKRNSHMCKVEMRYLRITEVIKRKSLEKGVFKMWATWILAYAGNRLRCSGIENSDSISRELVVYLASR